MSGSTRHGNRPGIPAAITLPTQRYRISRTQRVALLGPGERQISIQPGAIPETWGGDIGKLEKNIVSDAAGAQIGSSPDFGSGYWNFGNWKKREIICHGGRADLIWLRSEEERGGGGPQSAAFRHQAPLFILSSPSLIFHSLRASSLRPSIPHSPPPLISS